MALYSASDAAKLAKGVARPGIFFRAVFTDTTTSPETVTVLRLWGGAGNIELPDDAVETTDGATYYGAGQLQNLPEIELLLNGKAQRVEFTLAAVGETRLTQIADEEAETVRNGRVNLGFMLFDEDWQPLVPVRWLWEGTADTLDSSGEPSPEGRVHTLRLSVGSAFTGRRRPRAAYYTDKSQKARSSGDRFCERAGLYKQEVGKPWPRV